MKVEAVERKHNTCLYPMAKGALVGSVAGLVTKYAYPLNVEEKSTSAYRNAMIEVETQKKQFNSDTRAFLDEINKKSFKSVAEDAFVKMFDGMKDGEEVNYSRRKSALKFVKDKNPEMVDDFKLLCQKARNMAENNAKKSIEAYNFAIKHLRPTAIFVVGGAVVGALIALIKDVLRTDVRHH